jgi:glycosyltransferase involved in cell wall biosynthesis
MTYRSVARLLRETPHDVLYLNSFFALRFTILPLLVRRLRGLPAVGTVVAPRGEFSDGALSLKRFKKQTYIRIGKALGLFRGLKWHASTELEAADIRRALGVEEGDICVASNLSSQLPNTPPPHRPRAVGEPLRVVFLSRISPMKNLDFALHALSGIDLPVKFSIIGPEEDAPYSARCRALAAGLPDTVTVDWLGARPPEAVPQAMADHDLFFLPTHGENFGHVIAEALGAGTPVLLSDTTPWRGLDAAGVGRDLPLGDVEPFREALRDAWHQSPEEAAQMRQRAATYARERQQGGADVAANRALFERALSGH